MRYVGGKSRQAKAITEAILRDGPVSTYVEPFLGSAAVASQMVPHAQFSFLSDVSEDLIHLWRAAKKGWVPPCDMTLEEYETLRHSPPSAMRGFAGFAVSYNGKWWGGFGGYAVSAGRNYVAEASRSIVKRGRAIKEAYLSNVDYRMLTPRSNSVVYCDPPYAETLGYEAAGSFDTKDFWCRMERWSTLGIRVYVSEYTAPEGWVSILDCTRTATIHHAYSKETRTEGLFVYNPLQAGQTRPPWR